MKIVLQRTIIEELLRRKIVDSVVSVWHGHEKHPILKKEMESSLFKVKRMLPNVLREHIFSEVDLINGHVDTGLDIKTNSCDHCE